MTERCHDLLMQSNKQCPKRSEQTQPSIRRSNMKALSLIAASLVSSAGIASALTITKTVAGNAGPWDWVNGGLNTAYQYANENNSSSQSATPTLISAADGFSFSVGASLTISYLSGGV